MAVRGSNGVPSQVIIAAATLAVMFIGISGTLLWTISSTQQSSVRDLADAKIAFLKSEMETHEREVIQIKEELQRRRNEFVTVRVFDIYKDLLSGEIAVIRQQLSILESTRPTTGELQAASKNANETASRLEERVRSMENYLLGQSKIFAPNAPR